MTETIKLDDALDRGGAYISHVLLASCLMAILGDYFFWNESVGLSISLWLLALAVCIIILWRGHFYTRALFGASVALMVGVAPLIETVSALSLFFGALGITIFSIVARGRLGASWPTNASRAVHLLLISPFRLIPDISSAHKQGQRLIPAGIFGLWIVPIVFSSAFLFLFSAANPIIEKWMMELRFSLLMEQLSYSRIIFWFALSSFAWGFIYFKRPSSDTDGYDETQNVSDDGLINPPAAGLGTRFFAPGAVLRSLILFNILFALQTGLDVQFLWGGLALPDGMSYATYAHRGAYPLIITAALAIVFVVSTFGPNKELESSSLARVLVFSWIAQNVLLVLSSAQRLGLYVDIYSLSYWRVAAFIWMGLVAFGLITIIFRIGLRRSNGWLIGTNMAVGAVVLYACCFFNFADFIARYNVERDKTAYAHGRLIDKNYLASLGPHAIPAINCLLEGNMLSPSTQQYLESKKYQFRFSLDRGLGDWRSWSFRDYRLSRYLAMNLKPC